MPLPHHRGPAAERQEWGHRGRFRRHGQSDGIRSARGGNRVVEGDNLVGRDFYGHLDHAVGLRSEADWRSHRFSPFRREANDLTTGRSGAQACGARFAAREVGSATRQPNSGPLDTEVLRRGGLYCFGLGRSRRLECLYDPRDPAGRTAAMQLLRDWR